MAGKARQKETDMGRMRQFLRITAILGTIAMLAGCAYQAAIKQLPPAEQAVFRAHSKVMTPAQARTYLSKATAAERAAYLEAIGTAQRFQALEPQDREAVLSGFIRKGMSANALLFLWGQPYTTEGRTGHYEWWNYRGPAFALADRGTSYNDAGTIVIVYLVDGRVDWWFETIPSTSADDGDSKGILRR
jgi:hypothetical protein